MAYERHIDGESTVEEAYSWWSGLYAAELGLFEIRNYFRRTFSKNITEEHFPFFEEKLNLLHEYEY